MTRRKTMTNLSTMRFGFGEYDGMSASGWHVIKTHVDGTLESVAGPFLDNTIASRVMYKMRADVSK
jgi:hypothetical protein